MDFKVAWAQDFYGHTYVRWGRVRGSSVIVGRTWFLVDVFLQVYYTLRGGGFPDKVARVVGNKSFDLDQRVEQYKSNPSDDVAPHNLFPLIIVDPDAIDFTKTNLLTDETSAIVVAVAKFRTQNQGVIKNKIAAVDGKLEVKTNAKWPGAQTRLKTEGLNTLREVVLGPDQTHEIHQGADCWMLTNKRNLPRFSRNATALPTFPALWFCLGAQPHKLLLFNASVVVQNGIALGDIMNFLQCSEGVKELAGDFFQLVLLQPNEVAITPAGWYAVPCYIDLAAKNDKDVAGWSHIAHVPLFFTTMWSGVDTVLKDGLVKFNLDFAKQYKESMWKSRAELLAEPIVASV
jgi:hypothetical protein